MQNERRGPEFIWNTLEVSGPQEPLRDFLQAAAGPGFLDCRPDWFNVYEYTYFLLLKNGAPTQRAAKRVAETLRARLWGVYEKRRAAADRDPFGCPLDINALFPVAPAALDAGPGAVAEWMWANWGTRSLPDRVTAAVELRRAGERAVREVTVFRFVTQDWSPWLALAKMRERWPELSFDLRPEYLETVKAIRTTVVRQHHPQGARRRAIPTRRGPGSCQSARDNEAVA